MSTVLAVLSSYLLNLGSFCKLGAKLWADSHTKVGLAIPFYNLNSITICRQLLYYDIKTVAVDNHFSFQRNTQYFIILKIQIYARNKIMEVTKYISYSGCISSFKTSLKTWKSQSHDDLTVIPKFATLHSQI